MALSKFPYGVENKVLTKTQLNPYFNAASLEALIFDLREYGRNGYFEFEITLSPEYLDWERAHHDIMLNLDALKPPDGLLGVFQTNPYALTVPDSKIKNKTPLLRNEVNEVVRRLPNDMAEKYLRFKLMRLDRDKIRKALASQPKNTRTSAGETLKYNGLVIKGTEVSYLGQPIYLSFQQLQALRVFMKKPEILRTKDIFKEDPDVFTGEDYHNIDETLGKLVPAMHAKLKKVIGKKCIYNVPKNGWLLRID
jgi:hypothetical protein